MLLLGDPDVVGTVRQSLDTHPGFGACQRRRGRCEFHGQMQCAGVRLGVPHRTSGIVELPRIAIRRPVEHHHRSAGRDVDSTHSDRTARQPEVAFDRTLDPERLLDEVGDPVGFAPQQLLDVLAQHLGLPALARRLGGERIVPLTPVD